MRIAASAIIIVFSLCFSIVSSAQKDEGPKKVPASLQFGFKLPVPIANTSFRNYIDGISDLHLNYQQPLLGNLVFGGGVKHHFLKVDNLKTPEVTDGKINMFHGYAKLSYQKFITDRIFYDFGTKLGYSYMVADSKSCKDFDDGRGHSATTGLFIEPSAGIFMISDDNLAFGLIMSYSIIQSEFDPVILCLDTNTNIIAPGDNDGAYQMFNVGFGASVFIGKNKLRPSRN